MAHRLPIGLSSIEPRPRAETPGSRPSPLLFYIPSLSPTPNITLSPTLSYLLYCLYCCQWSGTSPHPGASPDSHCLVGGRLL